MAAHETTQNLSQYAASKAAVVSLTKSMALELAPYHIQVNAILPGYVETPMSEDHQRVLKVISKYRIPQQRLARADEVAELVSFLATCEATYMTGSELVMDGGLSLS